MDELRQRISEDLAGELKGELRTDDVAVSIYASDGSLYQVEPLGVAWPRGRDDVVALARYSAEKSLPLVARGAGSGVAGQSLGAGLIVDFSRYMKRVISVDEETVRVQPGVVYDELNRLLRPLGRYFPPDPAAAAVKTIGGMMGVDAAGSHATRVGSTRDHVQQIETVLAGGHVVEWGNELLEVLQLPPVEPSSIAQPVDVAGREDPNLKRTIVSRLAGLLEENVDLIETRQPPLIRNSSGYFLRGVLSKTRLNMPRLLVGSEGTLGLFTEATLQTAALPEHRGVVLLLFGQMEAALRVVQAIAAQQPSACDLLDRRLLTLAREEDDRFREIISPAAEAALLVEQTGLNERDVRERIRKVNQAVRAVNLRAVVAAEAYTDEDVDFLWSLPGRVVPLLTGMKGLTRPQPFVEDVAAPPEALYELVVNLQKVFQKHQVTATLYAHAASGQLHLRPFLPPPGPEDGARIEAIARDLYQVVIAAGGTISGEHGNGLSRTAFLRTQYGPLYTVFQQIKDAFDPHNLMNPGKIISDDPHLTLRNLRPALRPEPQLVELQLNWSPDEMIQAAARCNGCGVCRTQADDTRMCPFFRIDQNEEAAPRSKANAMRNLAVGALAAENMRSPEMKQLASLCFNCKQCQLDCPSNVNIPQLMIEAKAGWVAANGLSRADWIVSRAHSFGVFGSTAAIAVNWLIRNSTGRWLLEKTVGIARQRKLPLFARRPFLRSTSRSLRRIPKRKDAHDTVVYYVGDYANYHDPELARAFVKVLKHNGVGVHVPPDQTASGMAMVSAGDLEAARGPALKNVRALADLAREGFRIVCTEPSAAVCLKQEYPMLLDHPDVETVADRVMEAGAFLRELDRAGRLKRDFNSLDLDVGYHTPCHLKALEAETPLCELLSLIPGLRVHRINEGCSGMAGAFGLMRENFRTSIRIGWGLISRMRAEDLDAGVTECCSCKFQMEQGSTTPTIHPIKLLALAYGLMPEIENRLKRRKDRLVVS